MSVDCFVQAFFRVCYVWRVEAVCMRVIYSCVIDFTASFFLVPARVVSNFLYLHVELST